MFDKVDIQEIHNRSPIAEKVDGAGVIFGGNAARIMRRDLLAGKAHTRIVLPGGGSVESLLFSEGGNALAVHSRHCKERIPSYAELQQIRGSLVVAQTDRTIQNG